MRTYFLLVALVAIVLVNHPSGRAEPPRQKSGGLKVGDAAPDFALKDVEDKRTVRLSELKGNPVVLIFGSCT